MPMRDLLLILVALLLASPTATLAQAPDDGFEKEDPAFAPFRERIEIGDLLGEDIPAAHASASGCMVNFTARAVAPDLGVPLTMTATADARSLDFDNWLPNLRQDRVSVMIPGSGSAFIHLTLSSTDPTPRDAFSARLPARCSELGCEATIPAPGFAFAVFDATLDEAIAARDALRSFAQTCTEEP